MVTAGKIAAAEDVTIEFTGLCSFVPREPVAGPLAFCVVFPNAWYTPNCGDFPRKSLDGVSALRPHRPFLCSTNQETGAQSVLPLEGKRVRIIAGTGEACRIGDVDGLASFGDITSALSSGLISVVGSVLRPHPCVVATQVVFQEGEVSASIGPHSFSFDNYLTSETPKVRKLNHIVSLMMASVSVLILEIRDLFTNELIETLTFDVAGQGAPNLRFSNLCLADPLQWAPMATKKVKDDEDFRWHYEIIDRPDLVRVALNGLPLPIPRVRPDSANGNGLNCFPKMMSTVNFDPDQWAKELP